MKHNEILKLIQQVKNRLLELTEALAKLTSDFEIKTTLRKIEKWNTLRIALENVLEVSNG